MIVRYKEARGDAPKAGFIALRAAEDGAWVPIGGQRPATEADAIKACLDDVRAQIGAVSEFVSGRLLLLMEGLSRLSERPTADDRIESVNGQEYVLDVDGAVILPDKSAWPPLIGQVTDVEIDDAIFDVLKATTGLESVDRETDIRFMVECVLNQPLELMMAITRSHPDMLERVAAFMVHVQERQNRHER